MKRRRAFTLIELLVVIAIIAILAAILFPVFAQAKVAAKKTVALSGMKQMSLAVMMYTTDFNEVFPMGSGACWWTPLDGGWTYDTQPYVKSLELLRDASDPKEKTGWPDWLRTHENGINISYVSNGYIDWDGMGNALMGVMGLVQNIPPAETRCNAANWMSRGVTATSQVNNLTTTIMFTERFGSQPTWGTGVFIAGTNGWDNTGFPGLLPNGARNGVRYQVVANGDTWIVNKDNRMGAVSAPYNGKAVFAMCDGSAKVLNPVATNPNQTTRPNDNMWNAYRQQQ